MLRLNWRDYALLIGLLLLVTWLGASQLDADGIWADEYWSMEFVGAEGVSEAISTDEIVTRVSNDRVLGLLYPLLLATWGNLAGWSVWALRALSLLLGVLAVAVVFRLGVAYSGQKMVGAGAAALMGTSAWFVYYLHEMRMYTLFVLTVALFLLVYHRLLRSTPRPWLLIAFALATAAVLHSHYYGALVVAVIGIAHLLAAPPLQRIIGGTSITWRQWWGISIAAILGVLTFIPWLVNALLAVDLITEQARAETGLDMMWQLTRETAIVFSNTYVALFIILALFSLEARRSWRVWALLIPLFAFNLIAYDRLKLDELRYHMAVLPLLAIIAAFGLAQLAQRRVPALLLIGLWLVGFFTSGGDFSFERMIQRWPDQPLREMARVLEGPIQPDDVIINLVDADYIPELAQPGLTQYMLDFGARIEIVDNRYNPGLIPFEQRVDQASTGASRLWLIGDPRWEIDEWYLTQYLLRERGLYPCAMLADSRTMRIEAYGRAPQDAPTWVFAESAVEITPIGPAYVDKGTLYGWYAYDVAPDFPAQQYSVALHIIAADGTLVAQMDHGLPGVGQHCRFVQTPVDALPPGTYNLHTAVYNWQTGERLPLAAPGTAENYPRLQSLQID